MGKGQSTVAAGQGIVVVITYSDCIATTDRADIIELWC